MFFLSVSVGQDFRKDLPGALGLGSQMEAGAGSVEGWHN